jgi:trimeric autotransporter adhesin
MKIRIRYSLLPLALAAGVCAQTAGNAPLNTITKDQRDVDARVEELTKAYQSLLAQMRALGTAREDLALVEASLKELASLRQQDMQRILSQLESAAAAPGDSAPLAGALADQKLVAARLRSLVARLQLRQQELALAQRAKELAARQAANHPRTAALKPETPASSAGRVLAGAEQQAIREEALSLAEQVQRLRADPQVTPSASLERLAQPANLDGLRAAANDAADQLKSGDFPGAYAQQALLLDRLTRLSELGRRTPAPAEAAKAAADAVKSLLADQKALAADAKPDAAKQAELAARAEALRPQVDGVLAAAGSQVRQAAEAMRPAGDTPPSAAQQAEAVQRLETAGNLLNQQAEQLAAAEAARPPETPATQKAEADLIARFAREALVLQKSQEQLNSRVSGDSPPAVAAVDRDQTDLVRRTAALQQQVLQAGHVAASSLGQAAVRMSEALSTANPAPTAQLATASRQTAVERLAEAVALLVASAKEQQAAQALAAAQAAAQTAADQLAQANQDLQNARQQSQQGDSSAAQQSQQQAQQAMQQAQQAMSQAAQPGAPLPPDAQQAMSQGWQATQQAQQAAQQGDLQAAQQAAQAAQTALAQAQAALAQQQQAAGQGQQPPPPNSPGGDTPSTQTIDTALGGSGDGAADGSANTVGALSRRDREALAAARRQPVARGYTAQVEAYLDNLAEASNAPAP